MKENKLSKAKLVGFIQRFHLPGLITSAWIEAKNGTLETIIVSDDKSVRGHIVLKDFQIPNVEFGCFDVGKLLNLLKCVDEDIEVHYKTSEYGVLKLVISDTNGQKVNYRTAHKDLIERDGKRCLIKIWDVKIQLDDKIIGQFEKRYTTLKSSVTFINRGGKFFVAFDYSTDYDDCALFELKTEMLGINFKTMSFGGENIYKVLRASKDFISAYIEISMKGVAKIYFEDEDCSAEYWLNKLQD